VTDQAAASPQGTLRVVAGPPGRTEIPLADLVLLGRSVEGPGSLSADSELSRTHARVTRTPRGTYVLEDLGSTNGTYLNGWRIPSAQILSSGDQIRLGTTVLEVRLAGGARGTSRRPAILAGAANAEQLRPPKSDAILYVTGVHKSYGDLHVLKGVDLEIAPGEVAGLLGHNGAGKTTFVSCVAGLRAPDAGSILVNGVDAVKRPVDARRHLGIAPQALGVYPTLSVRRNLALFAELGGLRGRELSTSVEEVGEALSLTPKFDAAAGTLSGGQQRRLHAGMAMVYRPSLLILDEPTVGADIRTRQEILDVVKKLAHEGRAICYSTHYLPEIEELGASVALLQGGTVIARGSIAELVAKYSVQAVELEFDGPAPELSMRGATVTHEGSMLRIKTERPSEAAAAAIGALGDHAVRLRSVQLVRPSLDAIYLALTEQRYTAAEPVTPDGAAPGAPAPSLHSTGINWPPPARSASGSRTTLRDAG
jgi:ABC-2 type transport system ATP-binding protein